MYMYIYIYIYIYTHIIIKEQHHMAACTRWRGTNIESPIIIYYYYCYCYCYSDCYCYYYDYFLTWFEHTPEVTAQLHPRPPGLSERDKWGQH